MTYKERKEFEQLEVDIEQLELEKKELVDKMNSGEGSAQDLQSWSERYEVVEVTLDEKTMRWLELSEKES